MVSLDQLDFGQDSAESERENLRLVFITVPFYARLRNTKKWLVLGRKGTGKTAACLMLLDELQAKNKAVLMTPRSLSATTGILLDRSSINSDEAALQKWKFAFLMEASRHVVHGAIQQLGNNYTRWPKALQQLRSFLVEHDAAEANGLDRLLKFIRSLKKFGLKVAPIEGSLEIEQRSGAAQALSDELDKLLPLLDEAWATIDEKTVYILVDQVDDCWDSTEAGRDLIVGLLKAAKEINDNARALKVVVFLRSDIFSYLKSHSRFHDADKLRSQTENISWDKRNLEELIARRIRQSTGQHEGAGSLWWSVFPAMVDKETSLDLLVSHTLMRPRDLIQLCNVCRDTARNRDGSTVEAEDIKLAISHYSTWKLEDLVSEYSVQYPFLERLLISLFFAYPFHQLSKSDFESVLSREKTVFIEEYGAYYFESPDRLLQILYAIGFIGVVQNDQVLYESQGDNFILPYAAKLEIHKAFRQGLRIGSIDSGATVVGGGVAIGPGGVAAGAGGIAVGGDVHGNVYFPGSTSAFEDTIAAKLRQCFDYDVLTNQEYRLYNVDVLLKAKGDSQSDVFIEIKVAASPKLYTQSILGTAVARLSSLTSLYTQATYRKSQGVLLVIDLAAVDGNLFTLQKFEDIEARLRSMGEGILVKVMTRRMLEEMDCRQWGALLGFDLG